MKNQCLALVLLTFWLGPAVLPQVESARPVLDVDPSFFVDAIGFKSLDSSLSRLDIFVLVSYEQLTFLRKNTRYEASYEVTITLFDSAQRLVGEKLWTESVKTETFEESVSSQLHSLTQRMFEVPPGRYFIRTILRDNETRFPRKLERKIDVLDFSADSFSLSDIMLIRRLTQEGDRRFIVPNVTGNVGNLGDGFYLFFEAYSDVQHDSVKLVTTIFTEKKEKQFSLSEMRPVPAGRTQIFVKLDSTNLPIGDYSVYVQAVPTDSQENVLATTSRKFAVRWTGLPKSIASLDLAVDQLQYVAKEKELEHIKAATTQEEKQRRFMEFWKTRDPNPNTPRNEKMEEYYAKVDYANKHFKHYIEGWKTDMGMVYIMFGPPNNVDRHPFEIDSKPYEIWSYYDINYQFVFVDQTGFGDYRLTTPIWEVWQRARN